MGNSHPILKFKSTLIPDSSMCGYPIHVGGARKTTSLQCLVYTNKEIQLKQLKPHLC